MFTLVNLNQPEFKFKLTIKNCHLKQKILTILKNVLINLTLTR